MRTAPTVLVFDEQVSGTGSHYTRPEFNDFLGRFDKYSFHLVASSAATSNVSGQLEHGSDGLAWANKNGSAELASTALITTGPINVMGADAGTIVGQGLGRLRVALSANVTCRVKIYATGRDA